MQGTAASNFDLTGEGLPDSPSRRPGDDPTAVATVTATATANDEISAIVFNAEMRIDSPVKIVDDTWAPPAIHSVR